MLHNISLKISQIVLAPFLVASPNFAGADEIALTFKTHGVTIAGEYAGFRDNAYMVITTAGVIHVPANLVTCKGEDCLDILSTPRQES